MKRPAIILAALAALALLSGCSEKEKEYRRDASRSGVVNNQPMDIVRMADGFSSVGTKCDHGNRLYVAFKGDEPKAAIAVVPADPTCRGRG